MIVAMALSKRELKALTKLEQLKDKIESAFGTTKKS
jgi:hypothetical protein